MLPGVPWYEHAHTYTLWTSFFSCWPWYHLTWATNWINRHIWRENSRYSAAFPWNRPKQPCRGRERTPTLCAVTLPSYWVLLCATLNALSIYESRILPNSMKLVLLSNFICDKTKAHSSKAVHLGPVRSNKQNQILNSLLCDWNLRWLILSLTVSFPFGLQLTALFCLWHFGYILPNCFHFLLHIVIICMLSPQVDCKLFEGMLFPPCLYLSWNQVYVHAQYVCVELSQ